MNGLLYVALGGALGASCRYMLGEALSKTLGAEYPYGTMTANIIGSFAMGLLMGWLAMKVSGGQNLRLFIGVGLLGGFTTFSAFSLDAVLMYEKKAYISLLSYIGGSVILSIGALMVGLILARKIFGSPAGVI